MKHSGRVQIYEGGWEGADLRRARSPRRLLQSSPSAATTARAAFLARRPSPYPTHLHKVYAATIKNIIFYFPAG